MIILMAKTVIEVWSMQVKEIFYDIKNIFSSNRNYNVEYSAVVHAEFSNEFQSLTMHRKGTFGGGGAKPINSSRPAPSNSGSSNGYNSGYRPGPVRYYPAPARAMPIAPNRDAEVRELERLH